MKASTCCVFAVFGLVLSGCQVLPKHVGEPQSAEASVAASKPPASICPGLPAFAATVASYDSAELQAAAEGLKNAGGDRLRVCDQARLALLQARPGHGGFDPEAAEQHFAALLDADTAMDSWTRRFLVSSRDTLSAWMAEHGDLRKRLLLLERTVDARERTIRNQKDQIDALTSIERAPDRGFE